MHEKNVKLNLLWLTPIILVFGIFGLLNAVFAQSYWVTDPTDCPSSDQANYPGQNCNLLDICGVVSGIIQCYNTSSLNPPAGDETGSVSNFTGLIDGGYVMNCYANDGSAPRCDDSGTWWCDRDSSCYNAGRQTTCVGGEAASSTCGVCRTDGTGYTYCDGSYTDADGCEIHIDTDSCDKLAGGIDENNNVDAGCNCVCDTDYLDCNNDDLDGNTGTGNCEVHDGGACSVGSLAGTWDGCTCEVNKSYFETGTMAEYMTDNPLLWGMQYGDGPLVQMTSWNASNTGGVFYVGNDGKLGIGTSSPSAMLTIGYDSGSQFLVNATGTVIAGTWNGSFIGLAFGGTGADLSGDDGFLYISGGTTIASSTIDIGQTNLQATAPLQLANNVLSLNTGGNWTGTLDGLDGSDLFTLTEWFATSSAPQITTLGNLSTVGTISSGTWHGNAIDVVRGGTGLSAVTDGYSLFGTGGPALEATSTLYLSPSGFVGIGTNTPSTLLDVAGTGSFNQICFGASCISDWGSAGLSSSGNITGEPAVWLDGNTLTSTGTMAVAYGGTGRSTLTDGYVLYGNNGGAIGLLDVTGNGSIIIGDGSGAPTTLAAFDTSSGALLITHGGTGTTTLPGYGQILLGNGLGGYALTGTSTLGLYTGTIGSGQAGWFPYYTGANNSLAATSSIYLSPNGYVGIGTTTPDTLFHVDGRATFSQICLGGSCASSLGAFGLQASGNITGEPAVWLDGNTLTSTGTMAVAYGGTGHSSWATANGIIYAANSNTLSQLPFGGANTLLAVNSAGTGYNWVATSSWDTDTVLTQEQVEDYVGGMIGATTSITVIYDDNTGKISFSVADNWWNSLTDMPLATGNIYVGSGTGHPLATSSIYVGQNGYVGIGTTTPDTLFHVDGRATFSQICLGGSCASSLGAFGLQASGNITGEPAVWLDGNTLTSTGTMAVAYGGTGHSSWATANGIIYAANSNTLSQLPFGGANTLLAVNSAGTGYNWVATSSWDTDTVLTQEQVEDYVGGMIGATTSITVIYDDNTGKISFSVADNWWNSLTDMPLATGNIYVGSGTGHPLATSSIYVGQNGYVGIGTTTLYTLLNIDGGITITGNIIPAIASNTQTIGSSDNRWAEGWFKDLYVTNMNIGSSSISGSNGNIFTINSDNSSPDLEDAIYEYERGTVLPNAQMIWDSSEDAITFNFDIGLQNANAIRFYEDEGVGLNYVGFRASSSLSGDQIWVLPASDAGTPGMALLSDADGNLYWGNPSGAGSIASGTSGWLPYYAAYGNALTATSSLYLANNGYFGIGTTTPDYLLDVDGYSRFGSICLGGTCIDTWQSAGQVGGGGQTGYAAYWLNNNTLTSEAQLSASRGGFGTTTAWWTGLAFAHNGSWIATDTLAIAYGGTGLNSYNPGDLLTATSTGRLATIGIGNEGYILRVVSGMPTWATSSGAGIGNVYYAGNDIDLIGDTFHIEPQLDYVATITRATADLTIQTTGSGNILINPAGYVGIGTTTPDYLLHVDGQAAFGQICLGGSCISGWGQAGAISGSGATGQIAVWQNDSTLTASNTLQVAYGGTGTSTVPGIRSVLGLTDVYNYAINSAGGLGQVWVGTGANHGNWQATNTLGLQPLDADLTTLAGLAQGSDNFIISNGANWTATTSAQIRDYVLGLSAAYLYQPYMIDSTGQYGQLWMSQGAGRGGWVATSDLAMLISDTVGILQVSRGGTGLTGVDAGYSLFGTGGESLAATSTLYLASNGYIGIGTTTPDYLLHVDGQAAFGQICLGGSCISGWGQAGAISGSGATGQIAVWQNDSTLTASNTLQVAYGGTGTSTVPGIRSVLGLTDVYNYAINSAGGLGQVWVGTGANHGNWQATNTLGLQPLDADLTTLAGLAQGSDNFIISNGANWTATTSAQIRDHVLGLSAAYLYQPYMIDSTGQYGQLWMSQGAGRGGWVATSDLAMLISDTVGILQVSRGGTGLTGVDAGYSLFGTGGESLAATSTLYLASNGYIGIGTTTPDYLLHVDGQAAFGQICLGGSCISGWGQAGAISGSGATGQIAVWQNDSTLTASNTLQVAYGGTGTSTVPGIRSVLGLTDVYNYAINSAGGLGQVWVGTGANHGNWQATNTLGLQPLDADLTTLAGLAQGSDNFIISNGANWTATTSAQIRDYVLGLSAAYLYQPYMIDSTGQYGQLWMSQGAGRGGWVATSDLAMLISDTVGILQVSRGGTGLTGVDAGYSLFGTGGESLAATSTLYLASNGYIGIGTTTPDYLLHVDGQAAFGQICLGGSCISGWGQAGAISGSGATGQIAVWQNDSTLTASNTLQVAYGGTGTSTVPGIRSVLGLTDVYNYAINSAGGLGQVWVGTGANHGNWQATNTLGLQPLDADLTTLAGLAQGSDNFIISNGANWTATTSAQIRDYVLGLSAAYLYQPYMIDSTGQYGQLWMSQGAGRGGWVATSDLAMLISDTVGILQVSRGGTGLTGVDAGYSLFGTGGESLAATSTLYLASNGYIGIGTTTPDYLLHVDGQAAFGQICLGGSCISGWGQAGAISGSGATGQIAVWQNDSTLTASNTLQVAYGGTGTSTVPGIRSVLGLTDVYNYAINSAGGLGQVWVGTGANHGNWQATNTLGLQPLDADLTTLAGLAQGSDNFIISNGANWTATTSAQIRDHVLGLSAAYLYQPYMIDSTGQYGQLWMSQGAGRGGWVATSDLAMLISDTVGILQVSRGGTGLTGVDAGYSLFGTGGESLAATSTLYLASTGYIGIGTTTPDYLLHVDGQAAFGQICLGGSCISGWGQAGAISGSGATDYVTYWLNDNTLTSEAQLSASRGGFGTTTAWWTGLAFAHNGSWIATDTLAIAYGGTGLNSYNPGDLLTATSTGRLATIGIGNEGYILRVVSGMPTWATSSGAGIGNVYYAGNDIDLIGDTFHIEPQLDYVATITRATADLTIQTTGSGNILINPAGYVGIGTTTPDYLLHVDGQAAFGQICLGGSCISGWGQAGAISGSGATGQIAVWQNDSTLTASNTLQVAYGGTGTSTVPGIRSVLGLTDVYNYAINSAGGLGQVWVGTGANHGNWQATNTLGLQPLDADLTTLAGLAQGSDNFIISNGANWTATTSAQIRDYVLGLSAAYLYQPYMIDSTGQYGQLWMSQGAGRGGWVATNSLGLLDGAGQVNYVAYWSDSDTLASEAQLSVTRGGFGTTTAWWTGLAFANAGSWSATDTLSVMYGGTGRNTLTDGYILYGNGSGPVGMLDLTGNGSIIIGDGSGAPTTLAAFDSATGVLKIAYGGTGTTTAPNYGQILIGDGLGGYSLVGTSSLGLYTGNIASGTPGWVPYYSGYNNNLSATSSIYIAANGHIGIGTTSTDTYNLTVQGSLFAQDIYASGNSFYLAGNEVLSSTNGLSLYTNGFYTRLKASSTLGQNLTFNLPISVGSEGNALMVDGSGNMFWGTPTGAGQNEYGAAGQLTYYATDGTTVSGTSSVFIAPTGNFGIGTTSPLAPLTVYGNTLMEGANRYLNFGTTVGSSGYGLRDNSGIIQFKKSDGNWENMAPEDLRGLRQGLKLSKKDDDEIYVSGGVIEINGQIYRVDSQISDMVSLARDYAYWDSDTTSANITLSNNYLTASSTNTGAKSTRSSIGKSSGKWYFEYNIDYEDDYMYSGVGLGTLSVDSVVGFTTSGYSYRSFDGRKYSGPNSAYGNSYAGGDVIGIALDLDNDKVWFAKNGIWQAGGNPAANSGEAYSGLSGTRYAWWSGTNLYEKATANFGQNPFAYSAPNGFNSGLYVDQSVDPSSEYSIYIKIPDTGYIVTADDILFSASSPVFDDDKGAYYHPVFEDYRYIGKVTTNDSGFVDAVYENSWTGDVIMTAYGGTGLTGVSDGYSLFGTGGNSLEATSTLYLASNGYIGIGTTTPDHELTIDGDLLVTGALYDNNYSAGQNGYILQSTGSGFAWVSTTTLGLLDGSGQTGYVTYWSDSDTLAAEAQLSASRGGFGTTTAWWTGLAFANAGSWSATDTLSVMYGGTGRNTLTDGYILYGNGSGPVGMLDLTGNGSIIIGDGSGAPTTLAAFDSATGVLKVAYGGTGTSTPANPGYLLMSNAAGGYDFIASSTFLTGTVGDGQAGWFPYYAANGNTLTATSSLFLDTNGYLGIGTQAPDYLLTVTGSTTDYLSYIYNTSTGSSSGLYVRVDGTGNLLTLNANGNDIMTVSEALTTFNNPVSILGAGDVTIAQNLLMSNTTAGNIKFSGPGYLETVSAYQNLDLTLKAANSGLVVVDDGLWVTGSTSLDNASDLRFYEMDANGNNYVGFRASSTLGGDYVWVLPTTQGSASQAMVQDASGHLVWGNVGSGTVASGTTGYIPYYAAYGNTLTSTSSLYVAQSGYIGIGTTTPDHELTIDGDLLVTGALYDNTYSAGQNGYILQSTGSGFAWVSTTTLGLLDGSGQTGYVTYWSDSDTLAAEAQLSASRGGFGTTTAWWTGLAFANAGSWSATDTLSVMYGGTGRNTLTDGYILYGNGSGPVGMLDLTGNGSIIIGDGSGAPTTLAAFDSATGVLKVAYGGTGTSTPANPGYLLMSNAAGGYDFIASSTFLTGTVGDGQAGWFPYYAANGNTLTATSSLFLDTNGYLGIGTATPQAQLAVDGSLQLAGADNYLNFSDGVGTSSYGFRDNGGTLQFKNSGGQWVNIGSAGSGGALGSMSDVVISGAAYGNMLYNDAGTWRNSGLITLDAINNYVGIGTTTPSYTLDVLASTTDYLARIYNTSTGTSSGLYVRVDGSGNLLNLNYNGDDVMTVSGAQTTFNNPVSFQSEGDVYMGFDLNFSNDTAAAINFQSPGYIRTDSAYNNLDLTLSAANLGSVIVNDKLLIASSTTLDNQMPLYFRELSSNGVNYVGLKASSTLGGDYVWVLPTTQGSYGQAMVQDAAGHLAWGAVGSGTVASGTTGWIPYYAGYGNTLTATSSLYIASSGNIGIGTSTPGYNLAVGGSLMVTGALYDNAYSAGQNGYILQSTGSGFAWISTTSLGLLGSSTVNSLNSDYLSRWNGAKFIDSLIYDNGTYVGVGTSTLSAELSVDGNLLIGGEDRYINFGYESGTSSYGFRDNGGTMQYKNTGGEWVNIGSAGSGGDSGVDVGCCHLGRGYRPDALLYERRPVDQFRPDHSGRD